MSATLLIGVLAAAIAQQGPQTDTTFAVHPGSRISIETFGGSITVKAWDKSSMRVQASHGRHDNIDIQSRGTTVHVEAEGRMGTPTNVDFMITVPASSSLELSGVYTDIDVAGVTGDVNAETVQGSITVNGGARMKLESVEGNIIVDGARGRVNANTVNRGIRVAHSIGDVEAETVNGPIILQDVQASNVDLSTVNGRVVYDGTLRENGDYSFSSHDGAIYVTVPEKAGVAVSVSTFNGSLEASFPISVRDVSSRKRFNFTIGSGSARLDLESFGGNIYLKRPGESLPVTLDTRDSGSKMKIKAPKIKIDRDDNE
jgi:DUF4097 and DUF4098 domain-containing protein YvlB